METTLTAQWQGPFSWPGFEHCNGLPSLPRKLSGVYLQAVPFKDGYLIYLVGHAKDIAVRFMAHERSRQVGMAINIFDMEAMAAGIRKRVWNGFSAWWKDRPDPQHIEERRAALGYDADWGCDMPNGNVRRMVAFGENWRSILAAAEMQVKTFNIFVAEFGPDERLRKRLEAAIMDSLYKASAPFCDIPDRGMALSRLDQARGERHVIVRNVSAVHLHGLPAFLTI